MNVLARLPLWLRPGDDRPPSEVEDEIREEIDTHLAMLADENERQGMAPDAAREEAAERFGDAEHYARACKQIRMGDRIVLQRTQVVATLLLLIAVVFVGVRQWVSDASTVQFMNQTTTFLQTIRSDVEGLRDDLQPPPTAAPAEAGPPVPWGRVTGVVTDSEGQPIEGARVLAVFKTWPGGSYSQESRSVVTDVDGKFVFQEAVPTNRKHAIQIAVFADGYAFQSSYVFNRNPSGERPKPWVYRLGPAFPVRMRLTDSDGKPPSGVFFAPSERVTSHGQRRLVYADGNEFVRVRCDDAGWVEFPWFAKGDTAEVLCYSGAELIANNATFAISDTGRVTIPLGAWPDQIPVAEMGAPR